MKLLDQSAQTNWKFIAIIAFVAVFLAGGILMLIPQFQEQPPPLPQSSNSKIDTSNLPSNSVEGVYPESIEGWQTYRSDEFGFEVRYLEGEIKEFASWAVSNNKFEAVAQLNFQECYIAFLGAPFGIENEDMKIETRKDQIFVDGSQRERTYWISADGSGFAFINLDYPRYPSPYFLIYHSIQPECVSRINQILSTFRFVEPLDTSSWQTYRNEKYGFELKLPPEYELEGPMSATSSEYFYIRMLSNVPDAYLTIYKVGSNRSGYGSDALGKNVLVNGISGKEIVFTSTDHFSKKESPCYVYEFTTSSYIYEFSGYEGCFNLFPTAMKILSTFRFVESKKVSLPTNCIEPEGDPVITSISPDSGPVGTEVEIRGCHLTGFEGDLDAAFIRNDGAVIPLYGGSWCFWCEEKIQSQDIFMKVVVQSYCESGYEGGRYSGTISQCQKVEATPGLYKVHVTAWGKKSNDVNFTITQ